MNSRPQSNDQLPLDGLLVLDLSRMLPGAILARQLLDLGARLIKVEEPGSGDPMRVVPPLVGDVGIGFAAMMRGAESVALDLRSDQDAERLRGLMGRADVVVESFRPGTIDAWGLGHGSIHNTNPQLVWCSLSSYGQSADAAAGIGHDLNFVAGTGALRTMTSAGIPGLQLADVGSALLAASAILAALFHRERTGQGRVIDQPLISGPVPFVTWAWAEDAMGDEQPLFDLLSGRCACYRTYRCGDGVEVAVGALEPKFWLAFVQLLGLPELAAAGHDSGEAGAAAADRIATVIEERPASHWLTLAKAHGLPVNRVQTVGEARRSGDLTGMGLMETTPLPGNQSVEALGPFLPSLGRTPTTPAPQVGEHTDEILDEFGIE